MPDLHILTDPVIDFWKCSKKGLKNKFCFGILLSNPQQVNLNILNLTWWSIGTNIFFL